MPTSSSWKFDPFEFNARSFRLTRGGQPVPLEPKAQDVLRLLLEHAPAMVEKADIFAVVWKDVAVTDNALTRIVAQLRKALEDDARNPRYIETVATRGYRFVAPVTVDADAGPVAATMTSAAAPAPASERAARGARGRQRLNWPVAAMVVLVTLAAVLLAARPLVLRVVPRVTAAIPGTADAPAHFPVPAVLRAAQFTTGEGVDGTAAFSFDGTAIAFTSDRTGAFEIYVQSLAAGAVPTALTSDGRQNVQPAWSPDGRFVAYHAAVGGGVWVIPSRGGTARRVAERGSRPSWSPDGRWIAFQTQEATDLMIFSSPNEPSEITVVDVRTGELRRLTRPEATDGPHIAPQWSVDGQRVYYVEAPRPYTSGYQGAATTIWSVTVDGSDRRREVSSDRFLPELAVSPDERGAWALSRVAPGLWWLPFNGRGEPRQVSVPANGRPMQPAISRDGRMLAWTGQSAVSSLWSVPVDAKGGAASAEPLSLGRGLRVTGAAATPEGRLAYSGILQGNAPQVWTRDTNGAIRQVTVDEGEHLIPFWLDGYTEVAYFATHAGRSGFHALDVSSGRERLLFAIDQLPMPAGTSAHPLANLNILPDAGLSHVVMTLVKEGLPNLWVVPLRNGAPVGDATQVTFETSGGSFPHWSSDGRTLAYQCGEGDATHVCIVGVDGTGRRQLTHEAGVHSIGGWMGDDTLLVAARRDAVWNVIGISVHSGTGREAPVRRFTHFTDARSYVRYPQYDPAGKRILFERAQTTANIWRATLPR